jgi:AcrR family transcriptional regulator
MTAEFLWGERAPRTRGPKPALTIEQIADAAIEVADAEGLAAVSMQRVATDLGFTKMSLYRYLPGKAELVALMIERGIGEPPALSGDGWRASLTDWSHRLLAGYLRHPWVLEAIAAARPVGPHELGWLERAVAVLPESGLSGAERLDAIAVLAGHARAMAAQAVSRQDESAFGPAIEMALTRHGERFPALAAVMADVAATGGQDQAFAFGLDRILDGLESLIRARPAKGSHRPS